MIPKSVKPFSEKITPKQAKERPYSGVRLRSAADSVPSSR